MATEALTDDGTLGGYQRVHGRPPAFGGADGRAYTAAAFADPWPDQANRYGAALLFVAWADGADRPVGHLETEYLAYGPSPDEALAPLLALSLRQVKAHLDACIARARRP
ncbi:MAG TPA: hypothetical protein VNI61_04605 [Gemmatimonadales bacterium]|nr:hypothetical protein [Gemmatimonadales bacterium]